MLLVTAVLEIYINNIHSKVSQGAIETESVQLKVTVCSCHESSTEEFICLLRSWRDSRN